MNVSNKGGKLDSEVIAIGGSGVVNLDEANHRVRVIYKFTKDINQRVSQLMARLEALGGSESDLSRSLEVEIDRELQAWNEKVRKLGGVPKGLWLVDLDAGDGYYCWKYPEAEVTHWHEYKSGFPGRLPLQEKSDLMRKSLPTDHSHS